MIENILTYLKVLALSGESAGLNWDKTRHGGIVLHGELIQSSMYYYMLGYDGMGWDILE